MPGTTWFWLPPVLHPQPREPHEDSTPVPLTQPALLEGWYILT